MHSLASATINLFIGILYVSVCEITFLIAMQEPGDVVISPQAKRNVVNAIKLIAPELWQAVF